MTEAERREVARLQSVLGGFDAADGAADNADAADGAADAAFARLGELLSRGDVLEPLSCETHLTAPSFEVYSHVWPEAAELRRSGRLLASVAGLRCPVVAIHGDSDSHPAAGVRDPLARVLPSARFVLLEKCGHYPWLERAARAAFFAALDDALR